MEEDTSIGPASPDTANPISYAEATPEPEPIQIAEPTPASIDLPPETRDNRTLKMTLGVPTLNLSHEELAAEWQARGERDMREMAATNIDRAKSLQKMDIVNDTVKKLGRNMTYPEALMLQDMIKIKQTDPNAVIEENYAKNFMDNLRKTAIENPDSQLAQAMRQLPGATEQDFIKGQDYKSTREMVLTQMENAEAAVQAQTKFGRALDIGKFFMPLYQNWKLSGYTENSPFLSIATGTDLNRQAADWFNMPAAERNVKLPAVGAKLIEANPALALTYFSSILHQSSQEHFLNDFFPLLDVATIGSLLKGGARIGVATADTIRLSNQARTLVRDYAKSLEPAVTRAALHEATGDIQSAGVVQAAEDVIKNFQGKQVDSPLKPLHSVFVSNLQKLAGDANPSARSLGQETTNRLVERSAAIYESVLDKVALSMKVDRIPAVVAFQRNFEVMAERVKAEHPHLADTILDVKFRRDTLGSLYADIYMGADGQTLFTTERQASNRIIEHTLGEAKPLEIYGPNRPVEVKGNAGGFRTEQGSEYKIAADGTTTRDATRIRPGDQVHSAEGLDGIATGKVRFNASVREHEVTFNQTNTGKTFWKSDGGNIPVKPTNRVLTKDGVKYAEVEVTGSTTGSNKRYVPQDQIVSAKNATEAAKGNHTPYNFGKGSKFVSETELAVIKPGPSQSARGAQPASARTVYMDVGEARKIFPVQGDFRIVDHGNGTISMATPAKGGKSWGIAPSAKGVPYSTEAGVGKVPVELFKPDASLTTKGGSVYASIHFGNQISEMVGGKAPSVFVKNQGAGYYIVKTVPWDETNSVTRDLLLSSETAKTPASMFNAFGGMLGSLRTPEETLPYLQNVARKVATFGPSGFEKIIEDSVKEIRALGGLTSWIPGTKANRVWKEWERIMALSWELPHPETGKKGLGPAFRDPHELSQIYYNTLHRAPSEAETAAAFSYLRNHEILKAFNQINALKAEVRQGHQTWTFSSLTASKETAKTSGYKTVEAEGKRVLEMPGGGTILVVRSGHLDSEKVHNLQRYATSKAGKSIAEAVKEGQGNLVKLSNPHNFPMKNWVGSQWVDYVYSENATSRALDWNRIKVGRPAQYDYEHYVTQAIVHHDTLTGRHIYLGDRTIAGHNLRAMSRDVAEKLDGIRQRLQANDIEGARAYHAGSKLPQSFEEVQGWFKHDYNEEGLLLGPKLSLDQPIKSVPFGKTIIDIDKEMYRAYPTGTFKDWTRENFGKFFDDEYQKARGNINDPFDTFTLRNEGTKANPDYKIGELKTMDPMVSFQRAMSKAVNGMFLDDYKIGAIEHWIQEAKNFLKVDDKQLAQSPAYWFYNNANHWLGNAPVEIKNNLLTANMQIQQFLGIQDAATTWLHQAAQKLSDSLYDKGFPKVALIPDHLLPKLRDPFAFIRSIVFHPKVGLGAIPQLWVQASTFANIYGIAGTSFAAPATKATTFYFWSRINKSPEVLAHMDALAARQLVPGTAKFLPGQFTEATEWLERSGFANVSREHIYRDNTTFHDFLGNSGKSLLNAGQWFFEKGEQSVRVGAWYAAYLEMRGSLKTTGRLTETQVQAVLQRADLLSGNMSRASASSINKGIWSIPTQFQTFPIRMMEQITGKRLTDTEKMRLFGTYAVLYGIPGAFGLSGLPIGPYINKIAQDRGYVTGDKANSYINTAVTEGLPSLLLGLTTGNYYNIAERYSMQGFDVIKDVLRSDKTFLDIVGGAAYSTMSSFLSASEPLWQSLVDGIKGEGKHPFKIEDVIDPFKEIASVSAGARLYAALNIGKWLSRKEANMGDVSPSNAIFMSVFGLQPQGTNDVVNQAWTRNDEKQAQNKAEQIFIREMRRAFQARDAGNYGQADQYESRAYHALRVGGYPQEDYPKAMSAAAKDHEDMIARSSRDFYLKNVPEDRKPAADDAYLRFLRTYYKGQ